MTRLPNSWALLAVTAAAATASASQAAPPPRGAALGPRFSIRPVTYQPAVPASQSYFIFRGDRGTTIHSELRVANVGDAAGTVLLYPVDATTGQTSGTVYLSRSSPRRDVGAWVRLSRARLKLGPGETRTLPFEVDVPGSGPGGQHVGGIVAENATQQTAAPNGGGGGDSSFQIKLRLLTIIAVEVDLPGPTLERLEVGQVRVDRTVGRQRLMLGLRNAGNVLLKPRLVVKVSDGDGKPVFARKVELDTLLPRTEIDYPVVLRKRALRAGRYRASVQVRYGHARLTRSAAWFSVGA